MIKESAVRAVFERCLKLKSDESCLILTDKKMEEIAWPFFQYASGIHPGSLFEAMEPLKENGQEPPEHVRDMMLNHQVQLLITDKSLSHTAARRNATSRGARIASMPGITERIINRCLDIDYGELKNISLRLHGIVSGSKKIRITTELGTDISIITGKRVVYNDYGIIDREGDFGNLPAGEVDFSPASADGVYVVDASFPEFGKLSSPLTFHVSNGIVTNIIGKNADELKSRLDKIGPKAYIVAELGIGTNASAKVTGEVLEDEKVLGTCHIAIGNNLSYGGSNDVPVHLDGVITRPTIHVDSKKIMNKGKPLF
jgi:leucyl aminopeptidase (aminopeptidase T)